MSTVCNDVPSLIESKAALYILGRPGDKAIYTLTTLGLYPCNETLSSKVMGRQAHSCKESNVHVAVVNRKHYNSLIGLSLNHTQFKVN